MQTEITDVIVVGAGHAGCEAALAAARLGCNVLVITSNVDNIGLMPCNPSIGGPAKGQIVSEIDALGGEMGKAADKTQIQMKILNRSKGPAVQCLRSQNDKHQYKAHMKFTVMSHPNIKVKQAMIDNLIMDNLTTKGVITSLGKSYFSKTVVVTAGTFLKGKMHVGLTSSEGGRIGESSSEELSDKLKAVFKIGRLKTGTPPRLDKRSIDFSVLSEEPGDDEFLRFSILTPKSDAYKNQTLCHLTSTNPATHDVILANLDRSPMYTEVIKGSGPRYCPSIEDKVMRFKDNDHHHIFIEPEGIDCLEMYPQGLNTSLPEDVQEAFLKTMPGLENVEIIKPGYAVEYDFFYPEQLKHSLETKLIENLFFAGQVNGTSGYEEAAGQGVIAGINAGLKAQNRKPFILSRESSYIGTMIDDLITKNIFEPYRMMTSRSEYRLILRQDNAHERLSEMAYDLGLVDDHFITCVRDQINKKETYIKQWKKQTCPESFVKTYKLAHKVPLERLVKRPEIKIDHFIDAGLVPESDRLEANQAIIEIKYEGYIRQQSDEIEKIKSIETKTIPADLDYTRIFGLKTESREKLLKFKPTSLFEAKRIGGINPADILVLSAYLEKIGWDG